MRVVRHEPVLIGPVCVGKTSVSAVLAEMLGVPHVALDECADQYYPRSDWFDPARADQLEREHGYLARYRYREPVYPWLLGQVFADHRDCVFDLGAGHTCPLDTAHDRDIQAQLAPFSNVLLILPSSDPTRSIAVIRDRLRRDPEREGDVWQYQDIDFISHWVTSGQNQRLATRVIVTDERAPADVAAEIYARLAPADPAGRADDP